MDDNQSENNFSLTQEDIDIIGEVSNISMGSAATALSNIMGKKVTITSPKVEKGDAETVRGIQRVPSLGVIISYTEGVVGKDLLIIKKDDAIKIVNTMMGDMPEEEFGEIQISAIAEVMNQMMGSAATALSNFLGKAVNISPPNAFMLTEENREEKLKFINDEIGNVILVRFLFKVEDVFESDLYMLMTREFTQELVEAMMKKLGLGGDAAEAPQPAPQSPEPEPQAQPAAAPVQSQPQPAAQQQYYAPPAGAPQAPVQAPQQYYAPPAAQQQYYGQPQAPQYYPPASAQSAAAAVPLMQTQVQPVKFAAFDSQPPLGPAGKSNFELIEDVPLELSVEVGKAHKLVKEIVDFTVGSIIELDKQAGDPVDVIVNGQLIAHGEVVVIDESFGVRITEILDPKNNGK